MITIKTLLTFALLGLKYKQAELFMSGDNEELSRLPTEEQLTYLADEIADVYELEEEYLAPIEPTV